MKAALLRVCRRRTHCCRCDRAAGSCAVTAYSVQMNEVIDFRLLERFLYPRREDLMKYSTITP